MRGEKRQGGRERREEKLRGEERRERSCGTLKRPTRRVGETKSWTSLSLRPIRRKSSCALILCVCVGGAISEMGQGKGEKKRLLRCLSYASYVFSSLV